MVKSEIESVRMFAIKSNMRARLVFINGGATFDSQEWDPVADAFAASETHLLPTGIILDSSLTLQFNPRGMANTGTVKIKQDAGNLCQKIVIAITGSSRIDDCP